MDALDLAKRKYLADLCVGLFKRTDNKGTAYMRRQVRFILENTAYP